MVSIKFWLRIKFYFSNKFSVVTGCMKKYTFFNFNYMKIKSLQKMLHVDILIIKTDFAFQSFEKKQNLGHFRAVLQSNFVSFQNAS